MAVFDQQLFSKFGSLVMKNVLGINLVLSQRVEMVFFKSNKLTKLNLDVKKFPIIAP